MCEHTLQNVSTNSKARLNMSEQIPASFVQHDPWVYLQTNNCLI